MRSNGQISAWATTSLQADLSLPERSVRREGYHSVNSHFRSRILALAWSLSIAVLGVVICLMWLGQDVAAVSSATSAAPAPVAARLYLRAPSVYTYPLTSTLDICETYGPRVLTTGVSSSYDFDLGVDWCAPENVPVYAVTTGTVHSFSGDCAAGTAGCFVHLAHDDTDGQTRYSHLASVHSAITDDLQVSPGQVIGWVGKESGASSAYLHFEVHDGLTVTQRAAIHPLDTPFLPWTNRVSPTVVLRGVYTDATGMTALVGVTSPYTEPDVITVSVAVDGAFTDSRFIDYVKLNANANGDETLDDPLVQDVCIIPASLDGTNGYSVTMAFRGLAYSSPATVAAQALDVDGWGSTATGNLVGGLEMVPPEQAANNQPGQAATFVYTLTNRSGANDTFTLTHLSAQGWSAVVTPTTVTLDDGESVTVTVEVTIDADESGPPDCGLLVAAGTQAGPQPVVAGFYRLHRVIPPSGVQIDGPTAGVINGAYTFTATVAPPTTTVPITYHWQATGQSDVWTTTSEPSHTVSFSWDTIGAKTITVTAENAAGVSTDTHAITITAVGFPFFDGFEAGLLGEGWTVITTTEGRVQVSSTYPYSGTYSVLLDDEQTNDPYSIAALILNIDLDGQSGVMLDFWWRDFYDEHVEGNDGVYISDDYGNGWYQVLPFTGTVESFRHEAIHLDVAAAAGGMTFNDHFQIKFQFYDNFSINPDDPDLSDGYAIDNVWVRSIPLEGVEIGGPGLGNIDTLYTLSAAVSPPTATLPITYVWSPEPVAGQGSALVTYTWPVTGVKTITVTANNMSGVASDTHTITVNIPPSRVEASGPSTGLVNVPYVFTADVSPPTTTLPITYTWQATGLSQETHVVNDATDTMSFTWSTVGSQTVTVTATNIGGTVSNTHAVAIKAVDFPFFDGFELGDLGAGWAKATTGDGRVQVSSTYPHSGTYGALLDDAATAGSYSTAALILNVDLEGRVGVVLDFWWQEFEDDEHAADGVFISDDDGQTWHRALSFNGTYEGYQHEVIYLDTAAAAAGMTFNDHFQIKFQFYDDQSIPADGYAIDDVWVRAEPVDSVEISGPGLGNIDTLYTFSAAVSPPTATLPITYVWSPEPVAGQGSTLVTYTWPVTGMKTITITASNMSGVASDTHTITVNVPPGSVAIDGAALGNIDVPHAFTATVSPPTTTLPITYTWQAEGQSEVVTTTGAVDHTAWFTWSTPGLKSITVTAANVGGVVTGIHAITINVPPTDVNIAGRHKGVIQIDYAFMAQVVPVTTTVPITYVWEATGLSSKTHSYRGVTDTVSFNWENTGTKKITVTAANVGGVVSSTHVVTLGLSGVAGVAISGPITSVAHVATPFTATVSPITATQPVTYIWEFTDRPTSVVHADGGLIDTVIFTWYVTGTKTITVTAINIRGVVSHTRVITILKPVPPESVSIAGPTEGIVPFGYAFTATVSPVSTTVPITYFWSATDGLSQTHTDGREDIAIFGWKSPGVKTITVTAMNPVGAVTRTHVFTARISPLTGLAIEGPAWGHIQTGYTFTATATPITASVPITYHWRATDYADVVTSTNTVDHAVAFTWDEPGLKTITATAANAGNSITRTHTIDVYIPPSSVIIDGPSTGYIDTPYAFTADVGPPTATLPITYHWRATDQLDVVTSTFTVDHLVSFTWDKPGSKSITVTVTNGGGSVTATYVIIVNIPLNGVDISGPVVGGAEAVQTFVATVSPDPAMVPITYSWQATGQMPVTYTDTTSNTAAFTWSAIGVQTVTVTATNVVGSVSDSHAIAVVDGIPFTVYPETGGTLTYTDTQGSPTILQVPAGAMTEMITLVYTPVSSATTPITPNLFFAGHAFDLRAYVGTQLLSSFVFSEPITITIHYGDADVVGLTEETLNLYYREGSAWTGSGITLVALDTANNRLVATIAHLSQFALFGFRVAPTGVIIDGPQAGMVNSSYAFTATVAPGLATTPITYHWWATGQGDLITTQGGLDHSASFTWDTAGAKTIGVTVTNAGGVTTDTHVIGVEWYKAFAPLLVRDWPPAPNLYPIDNADGNGSYDVCWSQVAQYGHYELQEATNSSFTGAADVRTTTDTCSEISRRPPTRYYYRVRYCSGPGCSDWSNVEQVDVVWELEGNNVYSTTTNGPLVSGVWYHGYADDRNDYFWIETSTQGQIQVHLRNFVVQGWLLLYDSKPKAPAPAACFLSSAKTSCDITYPGTPSAGRYYIRVVADYYNEVVSYTLQVTYP
jgi:hypothetical protein